MMSCIKITHFWSYRIFNADNAKAGQVVHDVVLVVPVGLLVYVHLYKNIYKKIRTSVLF